MTNTSKPNLSLGDPPPSLAAATGRLPRGWLWTLLLLQFVICGGLLILMLRPAKTSLTADSGGAAAAAELKATALELENRSLDAQAAQTWQAYLRITAAGAGAGADESERANILYRVGKLFYQAGEYGDAAAALVRAEQAAGDDDALKSKIGLVIIDCLRRLGHYGEVGRELSRQVEVGAATTGKGRVLATFAGESFTEADLDRTVERNVDEMLGLHCDGSSQAARDEVLKRFSTPQMREQLLNDVLRRELFSRRARELKIDREESFRQARQLLEDNLLANQFLARELKSIQPTDVDINAYYQSHKQQYERPEQMSVVMFELPPAADAEQLLERIRSADEFKKVAEEHGPAESDSERLPVSQLIRGRAHTQLGNTDALFQLSAGEWTKQPHVNNDRKYLVLIENKTAPSVPPLQQIRLQVEGDYRARKRQELSEKLNRDLMARYDVKINPPAAAATDGSSSQDEQQKSAPQAPADDQESAP